MGYLVTIKNSSLDTPFHIHNSIIFGMGELTESEIGAKCIIGEFSRVRHSILGDYVNIDRNNLLKDVKMGNYSYTGPFDMIFNCDIGKFTSISYGVTIGPPEHDYSLMTTHPFIYDSKYGVLDNGDLKPNNKLSKKLHIGNDVWIGCNTTILRGINIGDGAVIGANSLVNMDVPPYAIAVGSPARIIKYRFSDIIIEKLLNLKWWEWDINRIKENSSIFTESLSINLLNNIK